MSVYVLVHGGDRDGSVWNDISTLLSSHGNKVFTPSMTSVTKATLQQNISEICECIQSNDLENIILVGHSYGGMVITGVADKLPDKISYMIYVDSVVPENGKSLYGLFSEHGFDYKKFNLTPDQACLDSLYFNSKMISEKQKAYIHCLKSEFIEITMPFYQFVVENAEKYNWIYFSLDTIHGCMFSQPKELAAILFGVKLFISEN